MRGRERKNATMGEWETERGNALTRVGWGNGRIEGKGSKWSRMK